MVTKKEIQMECEENILVLEKELKVLEEKHKELYNEDNAENEREGKLRILEDKKNELFEKKWNGNWGCQESWYYGRIPNKYNFSEDDKHFIILALVELSDIEEKKICSTKEYRDLKVEIRKVFFTTLSMAHQDLHNNIGIINSKINYNSNKICRVEDRGELIMEGKRIREDADREEGRKIKVEKVEKYKKLILEVEN